MEQCPKCAEYKQEVAHLNRRLASCLKAYAQLQQSIKSVGWLCRELGKGSTALVQDGLLVLFDPEPDHPVNR